MNTTTTASLLEAALPEISRRGFLFLKFTDPRRLAALVNTATAREPRAAILLAIDEFAETAIVRAPGAALLTSDALPACEAFLASRAVEFPKGTFGSHLLRQIVCERFGVGYSHDLKNGTGSARGWKSLQLRAVDGTAATPPAVASAA